MAPEAAGPARINPAGNPSDRRPLLRVTLPIIQQETVGQVEIPGETPRNALAIHGHWNPLPSQSSRSWIALTGGPPLIGVPPEGDEPAVPLDGGCCTNLKWSPKRPLRISFMRQFTAQLSVGNIIPSPVCRATRARHYSSLCRSVGRKSLHFFHDFRAELLLPNHTRLFSRVYELVLVNLQRISK